jgi:hypothetical protein
MQASVIFYDLAEVPPDFPSLVIEKQPELILVGLDAAGEKFVLLSGRQAHAMTVNRLLQLISIPIGKTGE